LYSRKQGQHRDREIGKRMSEKKKRKGREIELKLKWTDQKKIKRRG